jgi:Na+/melibiose symporter-like transporter
MYCAILIAFSCNIAQGLMVYIARYNLNNEGLLTPLMLLMMLPMVIIGMIVPALSRKVDKFYLFFWSLVASTVIGIISFFVGYHNMTLFFIFSVLRGISYSGVALLMFMFTPDCVEYGLYKSGINASGITFAVQTFTAKATAALATAIGAATLAIAGFIEGENAIQAVGFNDKLWLVFSLVPSIGALIALPILAKYKLRDKYVEIITQCNTGKITKEEAEKALKNKI